MREVALGEIIRDRGIRENKHDGLTLLDWSRSPESFSEEEQSTMVLKLTPISSGWDTLFSALREAGYRTDVATLGMVEAILQVNKSIQPLSDRNDHRLTDASPCQESFPCPLCDRLIHHYPMRMGACHCQRIGFSARYRNTGLTEMWVRLGAEC